MNMPQKIMLPKIWFPEFFFICKYNNQICNSLPLIFHESPEKMKTTYKNDKIRQNYVKIRQMVNELFQQVPFLLKYRFLE